MARRSSDLSCHVGDSQSTVYLTANPRMLLKTRKVRSKDAILMHCNSGVKVLDRVGYLPGYGTVWYEPTGIYNILSMSRVTKKFRVTFDSEGGNFSGWSYRIGRRDFKSSPTGCIISTRQTGRKSCCY